VCVVAVKRVCVCVCMCVCVCFVCVCVMCVCVCKKQTNSSLFIVCVCAYFQGQNEGFIMLILLLLLLRPLIDIHTYIDSIILCQFKKLILNSFVILRAVVVVVAGWLLLFLQYCVYVCMYLCVYVYVYIFRPAMLLSFAHNVLLAFMC